jgi:uncharacterized Tic20 family protein
MSNPYDSPQTPPEQFDAGPSDKGAPTKDNLTMAMLCHLLGALLGILGALIMWLIKKDDHPFIDDQGKESVNIKLTMFISHLVAGVVAVVSCGLLFFLPMITYVVGLVLGIMGAVEANQGKWYRYPINIRFIK